MLQDVQDDLKVADLVELTSQPDPRGATFGSSFQPSGAPIPCAWMELSTQERFEAGRQQSTRMIKAFCDLVGGQSPVTERQRVRLEGRDYDVTAIRTVVASGDEGAIIEAVSV